MKTAFAVLTIVLTTSAFGQSEPSCPMHAQHTQAAQAAKSPYNDRMSLPIKSLTEEQMKAYREGTGMGMAIPAELNGFPGPRHVLDLAGPLSLTAEQRTRVQSAYDAMHAKA